MAAPAKLIAEVLQVNPDNLAARQYNLRLRASLAKADMKMGAWRELMDELVSTFQEGYCDPFVRADAADYLTYESRSDEALELLQDALISDPLNNHRLERDEYCFTGCYSTASKRS